MRKNHSVSIASKDWDQKERNIKEWRRERRKERKRKRIREREREREKEKEKEKENEKERKRERGREKEGKKKKKKAEEELKGQRGKLRSSASRFSPSSSISLHFYFAPH